ncbi:(2Fe-2S) ferredoxin domain-containing protein [Gordonia sp. PDNC005]|uniref:(2Fe-2S) ferredoxin domain-containing protein n=1 Tax=unclassified Gordonia (in: high G+C Gram-positive bacteria) TaxID=2657482 RepID=UPI0019662CEA|nr:(2Fe-2S) ferredoxin domain-containing protein [Gordonia sp. PDNC005]QRY61289.1 (2Fe-2S) ferredoxin domain-containing protein [Gordonia sp. PDNC005]
MTAEWVIVTAPTDRGGDPADEVADALEHARRRFPGTTVQTAVLGGQSTVVEALDDAAAAGAATVLVVSGQTVLDRKTDAWFRRVIGHWLRTRTCPPDVSIGRPLSEGSGYAALLIEAIDHGGEPARATTAPLTSPAWQDVPAFNRHLLLCRGPRCSAQGSGETQQAISDALDARGLGDDDVLVTQTGCLFPCNQAPVAVVYPDGTWYSGITPDRVDELVDEHLVGGTPIRRWSAPRRR